MSQITTHVLDTSRGRPARGIIVKIYRETDGQWSEFADGVTDSDGRVANLMDRDRVLPAGNYKLFFETASYFQRAGQSSFYPCVEVIFQITGDGQHYHVPLLLNPFGYSTYRGS
ncbi:MAG: hydroxyisourate hydrolase [Gammaproteobacteria bacterium]|nr:hydroxyisourate hydrolase [Gammaproteobacteria bacterium]